MQSLFLPAHTKDEEILTVHHSQRCLSCYTWYHAHVSCIPKSMILCIGIGMGERGWGGGGGGGGAEAPNIFLEGEQWTAIGRQCYMQSHFQASMNM